MPDIKYISYHWFSLYSYSFPKKYYIVSCYSVLTQHTSPPLLSIKDAFPQFTNLVNSYLFFKTMLICHHSVISFLLSDTDDYCAHIYHIHCTEVHFLVSDDFIPSYETLGGKIQLIHFYIPQTEQKCLVFRRCSTNNPTN